MRSETGERIEKGRAERMAETIDGDFVRGILFLFAQKVLAVKCYVMFYAVVCDADNGRISRFDPRNEKSYKIAKEKVQQLTSPGRHTGMSRRVVMTVYHNDLISASWSQLPNIKVTG
jgi:hypothetical protein